MTLTVVDAIERATLVAVAPDEILELDGWLVAFNEGTIRRACSAVPLSHEASGQEDAIAQIEAAYAARGLKPAFRIADAPGLEPVRAELTRRGYASEQPTLVKTAPLAAVGAVAQGDPAQVTDAPDDAWASVFLGEGFDPVDGAYRVKALSRSPGAAFGQIRDGEATVAVGCGAYGHGWASFHGMRTDAARRGEGLAGRVLAGLAAEGMSRGVDQAFLQVEEGNTGARSLYRRAGFQIAWRYFYWSRRPA